MSSRRRTVRTGGNKRKDRQEGLSVGVTVHLRDDSQSLWENGIHQNAFFLIALLANVKSVNRRFIVNGGPRDHKAAKAFLKDCPVPAISMQQAMNELDVIIELGSQLNPDWSKEFVAKGGKIVGMHVANDFVIDSERISYDLPNGMLFSGGFYHEIWTLPAFEKTCLQYYKHGFSQHVVVMPHLWSSSLIDKHAKAAGVDFSYNPANRTNKRWRLAIVEPNICSVKACHVPMLIADVAHRHNSTLIDHLSVFNTLQMKEHSSFVGFARSLDLVRQGIGTFEGRFPLFEILPKIASAVIAHQWENSQNYVYYEVLHGGFPLIHNSDHLGSCGYKYNEFDVFGGAEALLQAIVEHDLNLDEYRTECQKFLAQLSPDYPQNVKIFEDRIKALFSEDGNA